MRVGCQPRFGVAPEFARATRQPPASTQPAMLKARYYLFFFAIAGLWGGGQMLYTALSNFAPTPFTIDRFIRERSDKKWLTLSEGVLDLSDASCNWTLSGISEVYAPLRTTVDHGREIVVLVATKDPATIELVGKLDDLESKPAKAAFIAAHRAELSPRRTITGLVRFGIDMSPDDVDKLRLMNPALASDFVVVAEGEKPDLYVAFFVLAVGIGCAVGFGFTFRRKNPAPPPLPVAAFSPPPLPGVPPPLPKLG